MTLYTESPLTDKTSLLEPVSVSDDSDLFRSPQDQSTRCDADGWAAPTQEDRSPTPSWDWNPFLYPSSEVVVLHRLSALTAIDFDFFLPEACSTRGLTVAVEYVDIACRYLLLVSLSGTFQNPLLSKGCLPLESVGECLMNASTWLVFDVLHGSLKERSYGDREAKVVVLRLPARSNSPVRKRSFRKDQWRVVDALLAFS